MNVLAALRDGQVFGMRAFDARQAQRDRALARNALVERYGPTALDAPTAISLDQNQRTAKQTEETRVAAEQARVRNATVRALRFFEQATKAGVPPQEAFARFEPVLPALGVTPEQLPAFRDDLTANPDRVQAYLGALTDGSDRRVFQQTPVYDRDGTLRLQRTYTDGSSEIVDGVVPANAFQGEQRVDISRGNLAVRQYISSLPYQEQQALLREFGKDTGDLLGALPAVRVRY